MDELHWLSAFELASMIRRRELKPSELMAATIARIEALNPALNAFCALRVAQAMDEARALDEKIARREDVGPLAGLPLGVKDLEGVAGMATTFGSVPFKNNIATADSIEVARLKAVGAIVVGKTNTPEFGFTPFTKNLLFGVTRNPWNLERTPGWLVGRKLGRDSVRDGAARDRVGLGRLDSDTRLLHRLLRPQTDAGTDPGAATPRDDALGRLCDGRADLAHRARFRDVHGRDHGLSPGGRELPAPSGDFLPGSPRAAAEAAARRVSSRLWPSGTERRCGAKPPRRRKRLPTWDISLTILDEPVIETCQAWRTIGSGQTLADLGGYLEGHREEYGRSFLASVESAAKVAWREYGEAYRVRTQFNEWLRGIFERFDLLLTPTLPTEAFDAAGPPPREIDGRPLKDIMEAMTFTYPFNFSGHPAASVRAGMTASGLPCGLQIVAERHRDELVLQASYAYEQARPWNDAWPRL